MNDVQVALNTLQNAFLLEFDPQEGFVPPLAKTEEEFPLAAPQVENRFAGRDQFKDTVEVDTVFQTVGNRTLLGKLGSL